MKSEKQDLLDLTSKKYGICNCTGLGIFSINHGLGQISDMVLVSATALELISHGRNLHICNGAGLYYVGVITNLRPSETFMTLN